MDYGNTPHELRRALVSGSVLGLVSVSIALILGYLDGNLNLSRWPWLLFLFLICPAALLLGVLPSVFFCIRVEKGRIRHLFARRFVLSDYPVEDFVGLNIWEGGWGAVLHFTEGRKIRFFGAHFRELKRMARELGERNT